MHGFYHAQSAEEGAKVLVVPDQKPELGQQAGAIVVVRPAGNIEAFSEDLEMLRAGENREYSGTFKALFEKHDMEIVGPHLPENVSGEH